MQHPLLDTTVGVSSSGSIIFLQEILRLLSIEMPQDLEGIELVYLRKEFERLKQLVHKMRSSALYIGTIRLEQVCQSLENLLSDPMAQEKEVSRLYQQFHLIVEQTLRTIQGWLHDKKIS